MSPTGNDNIPHYKVQLYLYDLSQGMARMLSPSLLGKQIDGIWHTGIVLYSYEYYYGGGIQSAAPGMTMAGKPQTVIDLGYTDKTPDEFHSFLQSVSHKYQPENYSLMSHNCNNFSDECSKYLLNTPIPSYITGLPADALNSPMGQMLKPMIEQMENNMKSQGQSMAPVYGNNTLHLPRISVASLKVDKMMPKQALTAPANATVDTTNNTITSNTNAPVHTTITQSNGHYNATTVDDITKRTTNISIDHPHSKLNLISITSTSQMITIVDDKSNTFFTLIKVAGTKPDAQKYKLTDTDKSILHNSINKFDTKSLDIIDKMILNWSSSIIYPVYGLLRMFILNSAAQQYYQSKSYQYIQSILLPHLSNTTLPMAGKVTLLYTIANMCTCHTLCAQFTADEQLRDLLITQLQSAEQKVSVMAAIVLFNFSITLPKDESDTVIELLSLLVHNIDSIQHNDALYHILLSISHIVYANVSAVMLLSSLELNTGDIRKKVAGSTAIETKNRSVLDDLDKLLATADA